MFSPDWDFSEPEPLVILIDCNLCGATYEHDTMGNHPYSECLEIQALNEEGAE